MRQQLCARVDFTPRAAFSRIDRRCRDLISSVELHQFVLEFDHPKSDETSGEHECRRVLKYYDSDQDGMLSLYE